jgi:2-iminobutanoate/2-iminopropanoate deaminase
LKQLISPILKAGSLFLIVAVIFSTGCQQMQDDSDSHNTKTEIPEYFSLRPETEKAYGYTHAVKIGDDIKISGAVSMDDAGNPTAIGDLAQQMKNCYSDLDKVLKHYGCTFDDVVVENIFTTNMAEFLIQSVTATRFTQSNFQQAPGLVLKS